MFVDKKGRFKRPAAPAGIFLKKVCSYCHFKLILFAYNNRAFLRPPISRVNDSWDQIFKSQNQICMSHNNNAGE